MESQIISYTNDEELVKVWMDGFHKWMVEARDDKHVDVEYEKQQLIYSKFAEVYDKAITIEKYSGPSRTAENIISLYKDNTGINILDYGCGTGLVADILFQYGYFNIDGFDCNQEMLDVVANKNHTRNCFLGRNTDGLEKIADNFYDVICSCGVFFLTSSHPGTECIKELCRIIKKGGLLIILTKEGYLSQSYVDLNVIDELESSGVLKKVGIKKFEGYRQPYNFEEDVKSMGVILTYEIL